jgi:hypothetical protein
LTPKRYGGSALRECSAEPMPRFCESRIVAKRIKFEEPNLAKRPTSPFSDELRTIAKEDNGLFDNAARSALVELSSDPCIEQVWSGIESSCGNKARLFLRFFIQQIICNWNLAAKSEVWPDYLLYADMGERLANFLKGGCSTATIAGSKVREASEFARSTC